MIILWLLDRMPRKSAGAMDMMSESTKGKPTAMTGVPQPKMGTRHGVIDGVVKGVPRNTHTPYMDGLVKSACDHKGVEDGLHNVKASATKVASQQFGSVMYADARLGK
jgi:hypothetical protein